jgi:hypothetical protein
MLNTSAYLPREITRSLWNREEEESIKKTSTEAGRRTLATGVERRKTRRDGHGAAIMVPVRSRRGLVLLFIRVVVVAVREEASAAARVAVEGAGEAEELVEGLAVHVVGGGGSEGGAYERRNGEVERVGGGLHRAAALRGGAGVWAWVEMKTATGKVRFIPPGLTDR